MVLAVSPEALTLAGWLAHPIASSWRPPEYLTFETYRQAFGHTLEYLLEAIAKEDVATCIGAHFAAAKESMPQPPMRRQERFRLN